MQSWLVNESCQCVCAYRRLCRVSNLSAAISIDNFAADLIGERAMVSFTVHRQQLFWVCARESAEVDKCGSTGLDLFSYFTASFHVSCFLMLLPLVPSSSLAFSPLFLCLLCTPTPPAADRSVAIEICEKRRSLTIQFHDTQIILLSVCHPNTKSRIEYTCDIK